MTISNAIPVQFWLNGVETFNEKNICGVEPVCFCQPFNCTDEIRIQFTDTSANSYELQVLDPDGNELYSIPFDDISSNTWQLSFIPSNYGICDENIQFKIITSSSLLSLSSWTNFGSGTAWTTGSNPSVALASEASSRQLRSAFTSAQGASYTFSYNIDCTDPLGFAIVTVTFRDSSSNIVAFSQITMDESQETGSFTLTPSAAGTYIAISVANGVTGGTNTIDIDSLTFTSSSDYTHAQSDCLDIKTSHDCTILLQYTNADDFNNIVYETSPTSEYSLRIPAQFWKEDNPMEQEDSELSNGVIKTRRQTITQKRYLEIGFMPAYMHFKTQLALMHDTVTIDGDQWKRRDAYESESIRRYPLKRANVWLTLYNSIDDNIL